ncbi:hypothetical protein KIW84_033641 [Lathyrus oleraceus]|uniref:CTLH domain-containing protein n=1 Tax=Pisum sativum TaxID=3888 RepID=A0A9D5B415_PEA|nr:hypothetical protein KIW84_033641 [Pisum sativum]
MSSLSRELVFLILQFLDEEKFKETVHKLEQESGFFFNMKYFEDEVHSGNWDEVERYLSGFTKVDDNRYSMKIFFEIRKQKYLEALDKHDRSKGVEILVKDLKVFATFNEELFKEITQLLTLENFRENEQLSKYGDTKSARAIMLVELKKLIEANPLFRDKLQFPNLKNSRLRTLINQSFVYSEAQSCRPSGRIRGKKAPPGQCNQENDSDCCVRGKMYTTYQCSPSVSTYTKAYLTLNSFQKGGDGGGPSECDKQYHSDDTPVVALSTGWFNHESRCLKNITISANGKSVVAMVVDECDSTKGCDAEHDYQPPCPNNIVDASKAVWKALGVPKEQWGGLDITWSDA